MIRVLAAIPYPQNRVPGQRFRIEQWASLLRDEGIDVSFSAFLEPGAMEVLYRPGHLWAKARATLRGHAKRLRELAALRSYDVLYVYREATLLGPPWFEALAARRGPLVFDFDDAIYLPAASAANAWALRLKPAGKTAALCRMAHHVTVGNEFLAQFARAVSPAVSVIPTTIDTDLYAPRQRSAGPRPVVGWTGSLTTAGYLKFLEGPLSEVRKAIDYELRIVGGTFELPGVDVRCTPWRPETEVEDIRAFDVGLMPLTEDEWSRGKCGLKALQYMALGIAPVVSPVGVNATIVRDGVNGFHARTEKEWSDRILSLLRDPELRARLGREARRTVEAGFSARVQAPRVARIFREAAAQRPGQ